MGPIESLLLGRRSIYSATDITGYLNHACQTNESFLEASVHMDKASQNPFLYLVLSLIRGNNIFGFNYEKKFSAIKRLTK